MAEIFTIFYKKDEILKFELQLIPYKRFLECTLNNLSIPCAHR